MLTVTIAIRKLRGHQENIEGETNILIMMSGGVQRQTFKGIYEHLTFRSRTRATASDRLIANASKTILLRPARSERAGQAQMKLWTSRGNHALLSHTRVHVTGTERPSEEISF